MRETMDETGENPNPPEDDLDADDTPLGIAGVLMERRERRRLDLLSYDGLLRENAKLYRLFRSGKLGIKALDAGSRALRRQAELLDCRDVKALADRETEAQAAVVSTQTKARPGLHDFYRTLDVSLRAGLEAQRQAEPVEPASETEDAS